ncbi:MAG: pyridoxamine 5'-phosphate oxidase family protein [Acidobacteriota bacterium]|nr:pyridoxamine 5'-phosphate oxidase family protein [Acidobacteriota bacterium]
MKAIYHAGELAVQEQAGVSEMAARVGRSIRPTIPPAAQEFLHDQPMIIVATADARGRVWASVLTGEPGFLRAVNERTLLIDAQPIIDDPLDDNLKANDQVGALIIEPATRRRMRLNGQAERRADGTICVRAEQVYSNCPKYIQARVWHRSADAGVGQTKQTVGRAALLGDWQRRWIARVDTFFIATSYREAGADASHRGGNPGFVHVEDGNHLAWGDFSGNQMFQTLGNISTNPRAGLLFIDFERGSTLQLTGAARVVWDAGRAAEFNGAERVVEFEVEEVVEIANALDLRWRFVDYSPFNPA